MKKWTLTKLKTEISDYIMFGILIFTCLFFVLVSMFLL